MKKAPIVLLFALAAVAIIAYPSTASAIQITHHYTAQRPVGGLTANGVVTVPVERTVTYDVAPADSDDDGCPDARDSYNGPGCKRPPPVQTAPAASVSVNTVAPTPPTSSVPPASASSGVGCVGMEAESGSLGYASPGGGCYQVIPSTAAAFGCDLSTPAGQDACAADICAVQGPSAWTNPAGENPCARLGG